MLLTLQVFFKRDRIYADYRAGPGGSHLGAVYPGGSFMGYSFDELAEMGTGAHAVTAPDPRDFQRTGEGRSHESPWAEAFETFEFALFGYQVGAYTSLEVLSIARKVDAANVSNPGARPLTT